MPGKTEAYEIFRHPDGGRKDVFRWAAEGEKPIAELEIYRPGGELSQSGPPVADIAARMDPDGMRELQAAGVIDSKFGAVTLLGLTDRDGDARPCLGFMKAFRRAEFADFRLVVPGRHAAGPARRDRLHPEPADPA